MFQYLFTLILNYEFHFPIINLFDIAYEVEKYRRMDILDKNVNNIKPYTLGVKIKLVLLHFNLLVQFIDDINLYQLSNLKFGQKIHL